MFSNLFLFFFHRYIYVCIYTIVVGIILSKIANYLYTHYINCVRGILKPHQLHFNLDYNNLQQTEFTELVQMAIMASINCRKLVKHTQNITCEEYRNLHTFLSNAFSHVVTRNTFISPRRITDLICNYASQTLWLNIYAE